MGSEGGVMRERGHPLLRGGKRKGGFSHGFSSSQIQSLSAICEAFIPSLPYNDDDVSNKDEASKQSLKTFYETSAAQYPFPDEVAEMVATKTSPEAVSFVSIVLKFLSTGLGTLLLCGFVCLDWRWPFIHKFSDIPLAKREKIIFNWSMKSYLFPFRPLFALLKASCLFTFFSWVNITLFSYCKRIIF